MSKADELKQEAERELIAYLKGQAYCLSPAYQKYMAEHIEEILGREKRIEELEKENAEHEKEKLGLVQEKYNLEYKIENLENKIEHHQEVINTLQKENAKLKVDYEVLSCSVDDFDELQDKLEEEQRKNNGLSDQLAQAKEILKEVIQFYPACCKSTYVMAKELLEEIDK